MATNLSLDPKLIEQALKVSGERTKKAAVTRALEEFIARRKQKHLLDLMGKLEWDTDFDYTVERSRRRPCWSIPASGRWRFAGTRRILGPRCWHCTPPSTAEMPSSPRVWYCRNYYRAFLARAPGRTSCSDSMPSPSWCRIGRTTSTLRSFATFAGGRSPDRHD
jgi:hypothetical protein